jgi:hypothetical protein
MGTVFATTTTTARAAGGQPKDPVAITATGANTPMYAILKPVLATIAWLPTPAPAITEGYQDTVQGAAFGYQCSNVGFMIVLAAAAPVLRYSK